MKLIQYCFIGSHMFEDGCKPSNKKDFFESKKTFMDFLRSRTTELVACEKCSAILKMDFKEQDSSVVSAASWIETEVKIIDGKVEIYTKNPKDEQAL